MVGPSILFLCSSLISSDIEARDACRKAFEAAVVHTGHDKIIKDYYKSKERQYRAMVSEEAAFALATIYFVGVRKEISTPVYGLAQTQSSVFRISPKETSIVLNWRF